MWFYLYKREKVSCEYLRAPYTPRPLGSWSVNSITTRPPGANDEAQRIAILVLLALGSRSTALCRQLAGPLEQAGRRDPRSRSFHLPPETQYVVQEWRCTLKNFVTCISPQRNDSIM